jgi:hypothetical protein
MSSYDFKQRGKQWNAEYKRSLYEREQAQKAARDARYQQNLVLKAHGYTWQKRYDISGPDGYEYPETVWVLLDAAGTVVTVAQAMAAIAAKDQQQADELAQADEQ